ncbi:MAG: ferredoxin, partial [Actinomycetota bacterium]|nr:ferredoxin [Actinomycetota bacterium]
VVLADEAAEPGGSLLASPAELDGAPADAWVDAVLAELRALPEVRVLARTTAIGLHDHALAVLAERRTDHLGAEAPPGVSRQRLWHVRAARIVLATGAHERPIVFADNDRPGTMLAGAVRAYLHRFGVAAGRRAVVVTNNDSAYATALDLEDAGVPVAAVVDARPGPGGAWARLARERGIEVLAGHGVVGTEGEERVQAVRVAPLDEAGAPAGEARTVAGDLLAVSGGHNPAVHLFNHVQGHLRYDDALGCFVPDRTILPLHPAGACAGRFGLRAALEGGADAGARAAALAGFGDGTAPPVPAVEELPVEPPRHLWVVPDGREGDDAWRTHFVDLERDGTVADLVKAAGTGMRSPEHIKRYTTIGTASDQGKTGNVATLGVLSGLLGVPVGALGTTTFRPPYTPVPYGLLAGRDRGALHDPVRVTPIHRWHVEHGAVFEDVGQWKRPWYFPRPGEDMDAAVARECRAAREGVAVMDASTLGKIDVQGPDAAAFLNRMYTNDMARVAVGSAKYGLLCGADGMLFDDGVALRLADDRYLVTTTTGGAAGVLAWFEEWLQTEWPDLRVRCTSVTEHWTTVAVVGPRSREVVRALAPGLALGAEAFPFMAHREAVVAGVPARVARISFSGELAFELNVPSPYGLALWEAVLAAGEAEGITPYGTEAMHVLRAEKGYVIVGQESDGTVTPQDLGMGWAVSKGKGDFVGRRSHRRTDANRPDRKQLVGLLPDDPAQRLPEGAQLVLDPDAPVPMPMVGHVTSSYHSVALGRTFALALVKGGVERVGETVHAPLPSGTVAATVTEPVLLDPEGRRRDG